MKSLLKLLIPTLGFLFYSNIDSKAQIIFSSAKDLPVTSVPKDFQNYRTSGKVDTLAKDTLFDYVEGFPSEVLYLDLNKDSIFDAMEFYALKGNRFQGFEKTPNPWKYLFFGKKRGKETYQSWIDLFINGLDGTEIREEELKLIEIERRTKYNLLDPNNWGFDFYNPDRKVDI